MFNEMKIVRIKLIKNTLIV